MSTVETIGLALIAVVQVLTLLLHQFLSARRHARLREEITSLRPNGDVTPVDNPLRLCLRCFHTRGDHADAGPRMGGPCNVCDCLAFVKR